MMTAVLPESPDTLLAKSVRMVSNTPAEASLRKVFSSYPQGCVCPGPNLAQSWLSFANWREGVFAAYVCIHLVDPKSIFFMASWILEGKSKSEEVSSRILRRPRILNPTTPEGWHSPAGSSDQGSDSCLMMGCGGRVHWREGFRLSKRQMCIIRKDSPTDASMHPSPISTCVLQLL